MEKTYFCVLKNFTHTQGLPMKKQKFSSFYLTTSEKQVGDKKRDTVTTYHLILRPQSVMSEDVKRFLCEYNRMTKTATFRNERGQIVEVSKMGHKVVVEYVYAMASKIFASAQ